jgi:CubicO group peptidase (beta-lactamase class C family)
MIRFFLLLACLLSTGCSVLRPLWSATNWTSHVLCSETFISGLEPERIYAESIRPLPMMKWLNPLISYQVDRVQYRVTTTLAGMFAQIAYFQPGRGCTVRASEPPSAPGPQPTRIASPESPPIHPSNERILAALDDAFSEVTEGPLRNTKAVVILHEGKIIAERYAPGYGPNTPLQGYSVGKSLIATLIGIQVQKGRLTLDQPAPIAQWQNSQDNRKHITIGQLLRMTSGLDHWIVGLDFDPIYLSPDLAATAAERPLIANPGTHWHYTNGNTLILSGILSDLTGHRPEKLIEFAQKELFDPLDMRQVTFEFDEAGTPFGSTHLLATARDWARLGYLYANDGKDGDRQLLPKDWVWMASTPTLDTGYGAGVWTNSGPNPLARERRNWGMPEGSFYFFGMLGQFVVVIPEKKLVVARFGNNQRWNGYNGFDTPELARLVARTIQALSQKTTFESNRD